MKMNVRRFKAALLSYMENSNIHGLKYIVMKNHHWSERLLWFILCGLSWTACAFTIQSIDKIFIEKPVAITIDTSYLDWVSPFPTVAICSNINQAAKDFTASMIKKYSNGSLNGRKISEQLFLPSRMGYLTRLERLKIPAEVYVEIYNQAKPNCSETFVNCQWNDKIFDCCNEFVTLHTGVGYCQMLNSKHAKPVSSKIDFSVNRTKKYAELSLDFTQKFMKDHNDIQIYFLNHVEIPTISTENNKILKNIEKIVGVDFNILDIVNEDGVRNTPTDRRECRFPEENKETLIYDLYSFDGCITDMDVIQMLKTCGCISYSYPRKSKLPICNMTGMGCISQYRREKVDDSTAEIICAPDCEGVSINWYTYNLPDQMNGRSGIRMRMLSTPHLRYQRYVVRSLLDVIVASGSSIGLFTGASILSFVEILLLFLIPNH